MKIQPIQSKSTYKNNKLTRFVTSLYYANKPLNLYKPYPQRLEPQNGSKVMQFLKKLFNQKY